MPLPVAYVCRVGGSPNQDQETTQITQPLPSSYTVLDNSYLIYLRKVYIENVSFPL